MLYFDFCPLICKALLSARCFLYHEDGGNKSFRNGTNAINLQKVTSPTYAVFTGLIT